MNGATPALVALAVVVYALGSARLARSALSGTMLFTALGLLVGPEVFDLVDLTGLLGDSQFVSLLLTATLVIVLFTDAGAINASNWRDDVLPARLLGIGLPLAILLGWVAALALLGDLELWEAAVLAVMLAPTDAALGAAVVSNPRVPSGIRQALNVESGLNDGIALPFFLVFLEAAEAVESSLTVSDVVVTLVEEVGIAVAVGVAVGAFGARGLRWAVRRRTADPDWLQIALFGLAVVAYAFTTPLGGSGFIAAWVAGLVFGRSVRAHDEDSERLSLFAETSGDVLTMLSFFVFGIFLGPVLTEVTWRNVVYAVVSLAVVRLAAVVVAMIGSGLRWPTLAYMGWFGPRGLATIILTIEIVDESGMNGVSTISRTALLTVGLSVLLHGVTAWWGSNAYADLMATHPDGDPVAREQPSAVVRVPLRSRSRPGVFDR
jgi:NhaP-type Na+/H+ or K+/H+ antiporter